MKKATIKKLRTQYHALFLKCSQFLERIKHFPWFSVLLLLMLGWGSYQVANQPDSKGSVLLKRCIKHFSELTHKSVQRNQEKKIIIEPKASSDIESIAQEEEKPLEIAQTTETPSVEVPLQKSPPLKLAKSLDLKPAPVETIENPRVLELEKQLKAMQEAFSQLKAVNVDLKKELDSFHPQLFNIRQALNAQAQQLSHLHLADKPQIAPSDTQETQEAADETTMNHYSVYAAIQGRAWLNTPNGKILTVRIGSILPPFGAVQTIDTENTLVYFDQGHVIGPSDTDS